MVVRMSDEWRLRLRSLNHGLFKSPELQRRHFDGDLVSMRQSGTHWVWYMLSLILAKLYNLPPPSHIGDNSIIGRQNSPPLYPQIPQIYRTHRVPHYLFLSRTFFRLLHFPKHLILVRDLRDALVSHYEKLKSGHHVDFSAYLRGEGRRRAGAIWLRIQFLNGWGAVAERHAEEFAVLKYEDLVVDTAGQLARVCTHFNIEGVTPDLLDDVVAAASKENMAKLPIPYKEWILVRTDPRPSDEWYSDEDRRFVAEVCRRNLKYTFGYRYW